MNLELAGHTAVVVGAARGIGQAIAVAFAAEKANIAAIDISPNVAACARELGSRHGVTTVSIAGDVGDLAAMKRAADEIHGKLGRIDHVVFAVAVGSGKYGFPFWNLEPADWARVLQINVIGGVNVAHAFAPALVQARS